MQVIDINDINQQLDTFFDQVTSEQQTAIISRNQKDDIIVMPIAQYNQLVASLYQQEQDQQQ